MKSLILLALAWGFYYAGDFISKFVGLPYFGWLYTAYNFLMARSSSLQDRAGYEDGARGPWKPAEIDEEQSDV